MQKCGYGYIRRNNLRRIIDEQFDGKQSNFAQALNVKPSQVSNMLRGKVAIGDSMAHRIEALVNLSQGDLDKQPEKIITAYIWVSIFAYKASYLLETLHKYECVKETAVVYNNEKEIFVKLQATEAMIQEILMQVIQPYQGVRYTLTVIAMDGFHWQREQNAEEMTRVMPETKMKNLETTPKG